VKVQASLPVEGSATAVRGRTLAALRLFPVGTGSTALTVPHVVVGGGWETRLILYNPMDRPVEVEIRMRRDGSGSPLYGDPALRILNPGSVVNEALTAFVPPSGDRIEGFLELRTTSSSDRIQGAVAFSPVAGGAVAALPAESTGRKEATFSHVVQGNGYWSGLALLAPGGGAARIELFSPAGAPVASREVKLQDRVVGTLSQLLPVEVVTGGYVKVSSNADFYAFELFGNDRGTILAAVPPQ
jgi:hypothetical protein